MPGWQWLSGSTHCANIGKFNDSGCSLENVVRNMYYLQKVRYEKRADLHEAFLSLGCALICWRFLRVDWVAGRS
jgi:hypothetical protein